MTDYYEPGELEAATAASDFVVPDLLVAPSRRSAAAWGAKQAAERLAGPIPVIKFFRRSPVTRDVLGSAAVGSGEIFVRMDLSLQDTAAVAAHETTHALGWDSEAKCDDLTQWASRQWATMRYKRREALSQDWCDARDRFYRKNDTAEERATKLCAWLGVHAFQSDLAAAELELRTDELEELFGG